MVRNTNDGTQNAPHVRFDISAGNLFGLPPESTAPRGELADVYAAVKEAGFDCVQGDSAHIKVAERFGLRMTGGGRVNAVGDADGIASKAKAAGLDCATLHVGWGMEDDDVVYTLVEDILAASQRHDMPLYIETHRATITQDIWRTVKLVEKFPEVRFNGDFSHWYTGLEMVYGGFENKLAFIEPVLERVRFIHGRIGNPGSIQVDIGDGEGLTYVDHFRAIWTRCFAGFLKTAKPGDFISFTPELLGSSIFYARTVAASDGRIVEEGDRWQQALVYRRIAQECWDAAKISFV